MNILFDQMGLAPDTRLPGLKKTLGEELMRVHPNYRGTMAKLPPGVLKGAAHITGGGLLDNLPRVLPETCDAVIDTPAWKTPRLCAIMQEGGAVPKEEMFQVFNMGVGMALVVAEKDAAAALKILGRGAFRIGRIEPGTGKTRLQ